MDFKFPVWGTNGGWVAQRVQCGRVKAKHGRKTKVCLLAAFVTAMWDALHVVGLCGLGDKISLFPQDWELAKMALNCHKALEMLCQEMHEAW